MIRWDEKAGLRRDAVRSQVIDVLEAQKIKKTGNEDCVLDEAGRVLLEQQLSTTPKAMRDVFGGLPRSSIALETGMHSR